MQEWGTPSLAAILPLKVTGRHYGDNLARLDVLFSSLLHFGTSGLLDELVIVTPQTQVGLAQAYATHWPELPLRVVGEAEHFDAFPRFNRPWQVRPWQRQQIIKLNAPAITTADYVLTLDPDVLARRPVTRPVLFPSGRALLQTEPRSVHTRWWRDSAVLLNVPANLSAPGMGVTPALLSRDVLLAVHDRLAECGGRPWMDVLLSSYCDWTEYTLYLLTAQHFGLVERYHYWCEERDDSDVTPLQVAAEASIWVGGPRLGKRGHAVTSEKLERLLADSDPGMFAVVGSSSGLPAKLLIDMVSRHMQIRRTPVSDVQPPRPPSKLRERIGTASRLVATSLHRCRRQIGA